MRLLLLFLLCAPLIIQGQELKNLTVNGDVINKADRTPVPHAHIRVKGKPIGISANGEGKFSLSLDKALENEFLISPP